MEGEIWLHQRSQFYSIQQFGPSDWIANPAMQ